MTGGERFGGQSRGLYDRKHKTVMRDLPLYNCLFISWITADHHDALLSPNRLHMLTHCRFLLSFWCSVMEPSVVRCQNRAEAIGCAQAAWSWRRCRGTIFRLRLNLKLHALEDVFLYCTHPLIGQKIEILPLLLRYVSHLVYYYISTTNLYQCS